jgi:hypothetical protein
MSLSAIGNDAAFAAAPHVSSLPSPALSGSAETFDVTGLAAATTYHFAMKVVDGAGNASGLSNDASATTSAAVGHLVISQIRVSGALDDVIELFNPTGSAIALSGYSVQYLAANGNFGFKVNLSAASIPAHGWYLVAANSYVGPPSRNDSLGPSNLSATAGHAVLAQTTSNITCTDPAIVDRVGYGATASCPEGGSGHHTTQPTSGQTVSRKPGGCAGNGTDTNVNDADFNAPAAPVFHNASSTPATPQPVALNDGPICEGATLQLTASAIAGATYAWTGPNGFASSDQNPTIANVTAAASGVYTVTVNGCTQATTSATVIVSGAACDDADLCTLADACTSGSCSGAPVACAALDQCHVVGTCDGATGQCGNPDAPNGSACDDGNACTTADVCAAGSCSGSAVLVPSNVGAVSATKSEATTTFAWAAVAAASSYDMLRGRVGDWPVGSHPATEACLASGVTGTSADDPTVPGAGEAYWYVVRAANACGDGGYGSQATGGVPTVPRTSASCP